MEEGVVEMSKGVPYQSVGGKGREVNSEGVSSL